MATAPTWIQGNAWADTTSTNIENGVLFPYDRSIKKAGFKGAPGVAGKDRDLQRVHESIPNLPIY